MSESNLPPAGEPPSPGRASEPAPNAAAQDWVFDRTFAWIVAGLFALTVGALTLGTPIEHLLLGWIWFLLGAVLRMTADGPTLALAAVCAVAFTLGMHRMLRWFVRRDAASADRPLRFRTTVAVSLLLCVAFAAGTAIVGAAHQAIWMASGKPAPAEPVFGLVSSAHESNRFARLRNELKTNGIAFHNVHDVYSHFPPGGTMTRDGVLLHGWAIQLAGFTTFAQPRDGIDFLTPWNQPPNAVAYQCLLSEFVNPSEQELFDDAGFGLAHFAGNSHVLPIRSLDVLSVETDKIDRQSPRYSVLREAGRTGLKQTDVTDGTSNTILVGQVASRFKPWGHPANLRDPALGVNRSPDGFGTNYPSYGAQFLMVDGSVRAISRNVDASVMKALATPAANDGPTE